MQSISAILIDDNPFVREHWEFIGEKHQRQIVAVYDEDSFAAWEAKLNADMTPIFIDVDLGDGKSGLELAKSLHNKGYRRLYLATAYDASDYQKCNFLCGVIGKDPPMWLLDLAENNYIDKLTKERRLELILAMSEGQKLLFQKRIEKYTEACYGANFGAFPMADGSGAYWPEDVLNIWESAIYESVSDEELEHRLKMAWRSSTRS